MNNFSSEPVIVRSPIHFHWFYINLKLQESKAKQKSQVLLNESAVLNEIGRIGEGLITTITQQA
jgi:hypothetical protein